jgi:glycosyltransferase involved in cell wall biosynthesis
VISFIIPAHDEELLIGRTLAAIHQSAEALREPYEIIVALDACNDRTGAIAIEQGADVVEVNHRQIAATRNAGARAALGHFLIFVDADTLITPPVLRLAIRAMHRGAVGGGCCARFDGPVPTYAAIIERVLPIFVIMFGIAGGCFLFCTRRAYVRAGGFDEKLYWGEEITFGKRLKSQGRFVILREFVLTSARKLRATTFLGLVRVGARLVLGNSEARRKGLEYWYGPLPHSR